MGNARSNSATLKMKRGVGKLGSRATGEVAATLPVGSQKFISQTCVRISQNFEGISQICDHISQNLNTISQSENLY